MTNNEQTVTG